MDTSKSEGRDRKRDKDGWKAQARITARRAAKSERRIKRKSDRDSKSG